MRFSINPPIKDLDRFESLNPVADESLQDKLSFKRQDEIGIEITFI